MVAYWSVYGVFSPTLYKNLRIIFNVLNDLFLFPYSPVIEYKVKVYVKFQNERYFYLHDYLPLLLLCAVAQPWPSLFPAPFCKNGLPCPAVVYVDDHIPTIQTFLCQSVTLNKYDSLISEH